MHPDEHARTEREAARRRRDAQREMRERHLAGGGGEQGAPGAAAAHETGHAMPGNRAGGAIWLRLAVMTVLSYITMYVAMYAMVDTVGDIFLNINQAYMAALMTAPMVIIELGVMGPMYPRRGRVAVIAVTGAVILFSFSAIRQQQLVGEGQFLRSMIPHHSGAILMCREASLEDAETRELCTRIIQSQREEIEQMNAILERLGR